VASNLATALAQAGDKVFLVDGDVRDSSLSGLYGMAGRPGLADLLIGTSSTTEVAQCTPVPRLALIPAGQSRGNSAEILEPDELARVFGSLSTTADVVVVDSGPVLAVSDPIALASVSDVVVIVADVRHTTRADVRAAAREISPSANRQVVGVLNNVPSISASASSTSSPSAAPAGPPRRSPEAIVKGLLLRQTVNASHNGSASRPDQG
jgi:capsular exopolysaccharide synthesis family protein